MVRNWETFLLVWNSSCENLSLFQFLFSDRLALLVGSSFIAVYEVPDQLLVWIGMEDISWKKKIYCDPSLEPSQRDGSNEGSQCMFILRHMENYFQLIPVTPSYLQYCGTPCRLFIKFQISKPDKSTSDEDQYCGQFSDNFSYFSKEGSNVG